MSIFIEYTKKNFCLEFEQINVFFDDKTSFFSNRRGMRFEELYKLEDRNKYKEHWFYFE